MLKSSLIAAASVLAAGSVSASSIGLGIALTNDSNIAVVTLTNNYSAATMTGFSMTIGDTAYNFDFVRKLEGPDGGSISLATGDSANGGDRTDVVEFDFSGFDVGEEVSFRLDIDLDDRNTTDDYRNVLFNNGSAENSYLIASFDDNTTMRFDLPDAPFMDSYYYDAQLMPLTGSVVFINTVPLPAGMALMGTGVLAFAAMQRRRRT